MSSSSPALHLRPLAPPTIPGQPKALSLESASSSPVDCFYNPSSQGSCPVPTYVVDLFLVFPTVAAVIHLGEDILGDVGHSAIAILMPRSLARCPPNSPRVSARHGHQLCQVHRVSGIEGQRPAVVAVTMCKVGSMVSVVGMRGMQGCSAAWRLLPGSLTGPGAAATMLPRQQGLVLS